MGIRAGRAEEDAPPTLEPIKVALGPSKSVYIRARHELRRHGLPVDCLGCVAARDGRIVVNHSMACRVRMECEMTKDEQGRIRLEKARKRVSVSDEGAGVLGEAGPGGGSEDKT